MKKIKDTQTDTVLACVKLMETEINRIVRAGRHADLLMLRENLRLSMMALLPSVDQD